MSKEHETEIILTLTPYLMAFPQSRMTAEGLVIYAKALSGLSIAEINAAMLKLMRTCRFFPSVAEIFEQAAVMRDFAAGSTLPAPDEAWAEVQREVRRKHIMGEWELSCPEVRKAADRFGRMELCSLKADEVNTARAQFMRIYKAIVERARDSEVNREVMGQLPQGQARELIGALAGRMSLPDAGARGGWHED